MQLKLYDNRLTPIQLRKAAFEFPRLVLTPCTQVMTLNRLIIQTQKCHYSTLVSHIFIV
jgi:hypothetical protein